MRKLIDVLEFCGFDLETTGLDPEAGAEPIEAGAVRVEGAESPERRIFRHRLSSAN